MKYFLEKRPDVTVHGVELEQAVKTNSVPADLITKSSGEALPYVKAQGVFHPQMTWFHVLLCAIPDGGG